MPKKRGNGEGSVYRRKDGLWVGQYKIGYPSRAKTEYIYSKTRKEAAAKLAEAVGEKETVARAAPALQLLAPTASFIRS